MAKAEFIPKSEPTTKSALDGALGMSELEKQILALGSENIATLQQLQDTLNRLIQAYDDIKRLETLRENALGVLSAWIDAGMSGRYLIREKEIILNIVNEVADALRIKEQK